MDLNSFHLIQVQKYDCQQTLQFPALTFGNPVQRGSENRSWLCNRPTGDFPPGTLNAGCFLRGAFISFSSWCRRAASAIQEEREGFQSLSPAPLAGLACDPKYLGEQKPLTQASARGSDSQVSAWRALGGRRGSGLRGNFSWQDPGRHAPPSPDVAGASAAAAAAEQHPGASAARAARSPPERLATSRPRGARAGLPSPGAPGGIRAREPPPRGTPPRHPAGGHGCRGRSCTPAGERGDSLPTRPPRLLRGFAGPARPGLQRLSPSACVPAAGTKGSICGRRATPPGRRRTAKKSKAARPAPPGRAARTRADGHTRSPSGGLVERAPALGLDELPGPARPHPRGGDFYLGRGFCVGAWLCLGARRRVQPRPEPTAAARSTWRARPRPATPRHAFSGPGPGAAPRVPLPPHPLAFGSLQLEKGPSGRNPALTSGAGDTTSPRAGEGRCEAPPPGRPWGGKGGNSRGSWAGPKRGGAWPPPRPAASPGRRRRIVRLGGLQPCPR